MQQMLKADEILRTKNTVIKMIKRYKHSADPDQMLCLVAPDQGLYCFRPLDS